MAWNTEESKLLKTLRLSSVGNSRQKLVALVHHFKGPNPSVFAITEGKAEPRVGKDLARKVRDLTKSGQLDWLVNIGREGTSFGLDVAEPSVGWWNLRAGPNLARFITIEVGAVSVMQQMCHASLVVEGSSGLAFPLHWGGEPSGINETQPEFLTIHPDVPGRLDVAFVPAQADTEESAVTVTKLEIPESDNPNRPLGIKGWDGRGCWIAQPLALTQPDQEMRAFLPPREYRVRIKVYRQADTLAFEQVYRLTSPERPQDLALRVQ